MTHSLTGTSDSQPARDERRWTLLNAGTETRPLWHVANDRGPLPTRFDESVVVMPVSEAREGVLRVSRDHARDVDVLLDRAKKAEAALAAARQVDRATIESIVTMAAPPNAEARQRVRAALLAALNVEGER